MKNATAKTIYLKDYQLPPFLIDATDLQFELAEETTLVISSLTMRRNPDLIGNAETSLKLDGQDMRLLKLVLNDVPLAASQYQLSEQSLLIPNLDRLLQQSGGSIDKPFSLECHTELKPQENTSLEGLYKSRSMFCTQCEAEGFRKISYYLDRPDVMSVFSTKIIADKKRYPVLLSNGNAVASGELEDGRHWVRWEDPFRKPCYLFALVAGDLACIEDEFITCSQRKIKLRIFVEEKDLDKCDHAMFSLKKAMEWDEEVYGREYDLDIFMIVAVDDFNMGAMENKGLNIFNTSCVLANPLTTTDQAFQRVEAVVAHEYFHNWSGNRVTCRDWFQLSLKEGFTVFRDSEFSADMGSRTVKRIEDVSFLRTAQFAEDAGPMAHSVRPDSYMEISNFYTLTIYEKGAEIVRMIHELVGADAFRKGSDLYFERHDGQAVTTEDFVRAMEDASGVDLKQFRRWYAQAGTPRLRITGDYDATAREYRLEVQQSCPPTPGQEHKQALHIPLRVGLLDSAGLDIPLLLKGESQNTGLTERVLDVCAEQQTFVFTGIDSKPVPSLLRGFSAPVKLEFDYSQQELLFLMTRDSDGFNRWNAAQELALRVMLPLLQDYREKRSLQLDAGLLQAFTDILEEALQRVDDKEGYDQAVTAQLLSLPTEAYLGELSDSIDVEAIHAVRKFLIQALAGRLEQQFASLYAAIPDITPYQANAEGIAARSLRNLCLSYLVSLEKPDYLDSCYQQFSHAGNMTDTSQALRLLVNSESSHAETLREEALQQFLKKWRHEALVVDQWFSVQSAASRPGTLQRVQALLQHEAFDIRNPNKVRAVLGVFSNQNAINFHDRSGEAYRFLADQVLILNRLNPQIAARLLTPLSRWRRYDEDRQQLMKAQLERIAAEDGLSSDVFEVVLKSLK
ncbi:MAG: aminopeptidase N [Pseudomonadales bacterium]|nr:aminopeptidase N [Pseudomonadales bacterium]